MSYYILPKKHTIININPKLVENNFTNDSNVLKPIVSQSLIYYLNIITEQIKDFFNNEVTTNESCNNTISYDMICKIINPYEFIFSKVPNLKYSVSKLKPQSNIFFIIMEILNNFNVFDYMNENINTIHLGKNSHSIIECMNILREDYNDNHIFFELNESSNIQDLVKKYSEMKLLNIQKQSIDFLYFDLNNHIYTDSNKYTTGLIIFLQLILSYQKENGVTIIKIDNIFYKPIIDVLYILTYLYNKVYIVKPCTTSVITNERYLVCKNFIDKKNELLMNNLELLIKKLNNGNFIVESLISENLPSYFMNKIEDSNINIGHQQIEHLDLMLHIIKNKNRDDKIDALKKSNIIKCIQWCEKFKIPHNKFVDKINIFLPHNESNLYTSYNNEEYIFSNKLLDDINIEI
jgi:hypothetical protein